MLDPMREPDDLTPEEQAEIDAFEDVTDDPAEAVVTFVPRRPA